MLLSTIKPIDPFHLFNMLFTLPLSLLALVGAVVAVPDASQKAPYGYATLNGGKLFLSTV